MEQRTGTVDVSNQLFDRSLAACSSQATIVKTQQPTSRDIRSIERVRMQSMSR